MKAQELGVVGWCKNTADGTVVGIVQGPEGSVEQMKEWLAKIGSPKSKIDRCVFEDEKEVDSVEFEGFTVDRSYGFAPR